MTQSSRRHLVVIDAANAIYRAFFALPPLRAPDGTPTNAALGFTNMLLKVIREEAPDFVAVALDPRGGSFRSRIYGDYKATREAQPEDLSVQMSLVRELIDALRIPVLEVADFEADDVIASLTKTLPDDVRVTIVSTDKDLMQLVSDRVSLLDGMKDRRYGPAEVEERFGVPPSRILDMRALVGDPSDNIPGVKGIGEKGAAKLIGEFETLENLLEHAGEVKAKRAREALLAQAEDARLSKHLATLREDVLIPVELGDLALPEPDREKLRELYRRLDFSRLLDALDAETGGEVAATRASLREVAVTVLSDPSELSAILAALDPEAALVLQLIAGEGGDVEAPLVGLAFAQEETSACFVPFAGTDLFAHAGLPVEAALDALRACFASGKSAEWIGTESKRAQCLLAEHGLELPMPAFDSEIAAFLLDPSGSHTVAAVASQYLGRDLQTWEQLAGRGAKAVPAEQLPVESLARWAATQVCAIAELRPRLRERLEVDGLAELFDTVEMPLTSVLARMQRAGVRIDEGRLASLSREYERELERIEADIYRLAGEKFLVNSPKQLQRILFEKLGLPVIKKTKTGYSTDEAVLEQLVPHHELPERVLAWRRLSKLKSTYIDAIPPLVSERSGRIHPIFHQTGAATGRLSASNPNVQNIPIRTEEGVRIREAFVPAEGRLLLSADYSQVELRILAHYSGDASLIDAFEKGEDIHRRTAAEVAGITPDAVTADQRARAKAVNFGIIYGLSSFGLANQLGIATGEAQETIDAYFELYRGVRRFLDETVAEAKERGYVFTLLGRRRYLPDLRSRNRVLRQAAERMAVNSVIQGTAADLIKKAMVAIDRAIESSELAALMILQVHDELVFEVPSDGLAALEELVRGCMQGVFELRVPLVVDMGHGSNWREAH